jgi:subtilisin family serine protease
MASFKVKASLLNVRTEPVENFTDKKNVIGKLKKDAPFESIDEKVNKLGTWYKDANQHWVWGEGLDSPRKNLTSEFQEAVAQNDLLKTIILNETVQTNGTNIVIGILDSEIDFKNSSLKAACLGFENCLTQSQQPNIINNHGTKVAGVIVGKDAIISGIATDAKIRSYVTIDENGNTDDKAVLKALNTIIEGNVNVDILNLSFDITNSIKEEVQICITKLAAKGIIVVVAGFSQLFGDISNLSKIAGTFPIGIFEQSEVDDLKQQGLPKPYKLAFCNAEIITLGIIDSSSPHPMFSSSSAYTAIATGIIARFLSSNPIPFALRIDEVSKYLNKTSFLIQKDNLITSFKPYRNEKN